MGDLAIDDSDVDRIAAERAALYAEVTILRDLLAKVIDEDIQSAIGHGLTLMLHTKIADVLARRS